MLNQWVFNDSSVAVFYLAVDATPNLSIAIPFHVPWFFNGVANAFSGTQMQPSCNLCVRKSFLNQWLFNGLQLSPFLNRKPMQHHTVAMANHCNSHGFPMVLHGFVLAMGIRCSRKYLPWRNHCLTSGFQWFLATRLGSWLSVKGLPLLVKVSFVNREGWAC